MDNKILFDFNSKKLGLITNVPLLNKTFSTLYLENSNIENIKKIFISENRYNISNNLEQLTNIIIKYINIWIQLGKFKKIDNDIIKNIDNTDYTELLNSYNKNFLNVFTNNIIKDLNLKKINNNEYQDYNPFRDTLNNKLFKDFNVNDYRELNVQTTDNMLFNFNRNVSLKNNNQNIPIYRQQLHKRHYDKNDIESLYQGNEKTNIIYKRYDLSELY